ncbi:MAG TPA: hypothetical protein VGW75_07005 [Solirubrobacteraceae bacterium]|jgi:hypothetical protein|nr:hypothetical protein [Solirubrobacteraceae bacterium]
MRLIVAVAAVVVVAAIVYVSGVLGDDRSTAAVCDVFHTEGKQFVDEAEANIAAGDTFGVFVDLIAFPGRAADLINEMADVAPKDIEPEFRTVADGFETVAKKQGQHALNPVQAIIDGIAISARTKSAMRETDQYLRGHCGEYPGDPDGPGGRTSPNEAPQNGTQPSQDPLPESAFSGIRLTTYRLIGPDGNTSDTRAIITDNRDALDVCTYGLDGNGVAYFEGRGYAVYLRDNYGLSGRLRDTSGTISAEEEESGTDTAFVDEETRASEGYEQRDGPCVALIPRRPLGDWTITLEIKRGDEVAYSKSDSVTVE